MPKLNGIEAVRQIKKTEPGVKVVFLTMHADISYVPLKQAHRAMS
jgi:DNA-binding NarL/FixJ family response regulator